MPLSLTEQIDIIEGREAPPNANVDLTNLVSQEARNQSKTFVDGVKTVDGETNPLAESYKSKMLTLCKSAFQGSVSIANALKSTLVAIGAPSTDLATIQGLTQTGWETFVTNNMFDAFEYVAGVTSEEKTDYDALP